MLRASQTVKKQTKEEDIGEYSRKPAFEKVDVFLDKEKQNN